MRHHTIRRGEHNRKHADNIKLLLTFASRPPSPHISVGGGFTVDRETSSFISQTDRRRYMFHGVNVVEKTHQFIPTPDQPAAEDVPTIDPIRGLNTASAP